jgi:hypothetical protein
MDEKKEKGLQNKTTSSPVRSPVRDMTGKTENSFYSFRYSSRTMTFSGGRTYVRASEKRFENGRLESEEFEGEMDSSVYFDNVENMQRQFMEVFQSFFKPLTSLMSFFPGNNRKK